MASIHSDPLGQGWKPAHCDDRSLDHGTGMSRRGVMKGCAGLVEKGIITVERRLSELGDNEINIVRKHLAESQTDAVGTVPPSATIDRN